MCRYPEDIMIDSKSILSFIIMAHDNNKYHDIVQLTSQQTVHIFQLECPFIHMNKFQTELWLSSSSSAYLLEKRGEEEMWWSCPLLLRTKPLFPSLREPDTTPYTDRHYTPRTAHNTCSHRTH